MRSRRSLVYVRFVFSDVHHFSNFETGVFQAAARLREDPSLPEYEYAVLLELGDWFNLHLEKPARFTNSKPPYYRKQSRAISWFKDTAAEHIVRAREMVFILENHGIHVRMITTDRPGYVVYEDEFQVVAEPFADAEF